MHHTLPPGFVLRLWHYRRLCLWWWLRVCLLALVMTGCTTGLQGTMRHNAHVLADAERDLAAARRRHDRIREGLALNNLGDAYRALGQPTTALASLTPALAIWRAEHDRTREAQTLNNLGVVYEVLSQYAQALTSHTQALALRRAVGDQRGEAQTLNNLGVVYEAMSQYAYALTHYEQALSIAREVGDRRREALILSNSGTVYEAMSQYAQALTHYEQALGIAREIGDRRREGQALNNLGKVYTALSQYPHALTSHTQALALRRAVGDRREEGRSLNNLGYVYRAMSQYAQALTHYEQALGIAREVGDRRKEGQTLNNVGAVYAAMSQYPHALTHYEQALGIAREVGDRHGEGVALTRLGTVYYALRQYDQARASSEQALAFLQEVGDREREGMTFGQLMAVWKAQHQPRLAIFYGKQAVNVFQEIRGRLRSLTAALQEGFLTPRAPIYRELADILIAEGRLPEAQQVLELLKHEEYLDFVRRDASAATALPRGATVTPEETVWTARYRAIADRLAALGTEYGVLRQQPAHTGAETQRLSALEADLRVARQAFEQFLVALTAEARATPQAHATIERLTEESQGLMDALRDLGPGTVALYTLVTETAYRVILTTPEVQLARETPIAAADLARKIHAFREALNPARPRGLLRDPRPLAHELYQLLVAPIVRDLQQAQAATLMWSLDGVLRYLPLAALYDGEQYLLERYRLAVFTPASATRLKDQPSPQWSSAGFGVSKAHEGFTALPTVPDELRGIIRDPTQPTSHGVLPGRIYLDEAFTDAALRAVLHQRYPVVHIASHFQLHPGDDTASFLLLGDGRHLPLAQLKTWPQPFQGVELLTLSACNTAVGSAGAEGTEVEGLAVLAQRQGAKAVVATLWAVVDTSTQELMQTFYRLREGLPGLPKVEALRQAQLALLRGTGPSGVATQMCARGIVLDEGARSGYGGTLPPFVPDPQAPYAHPAYWAPFVLIGNWR